MASADYKEPLPDVDYRDVESGEGWRADTAEGLTTGAGDAVSPSSPMIAVPGTNKNKKKSPPLKSNLNSCSMCIRYVLIIGNCIFFLLACIVIGLGIHLVVDKVNLISQVFGIPLIAPASYLILTAGCIVFIISFIGCFGALFESRTALILYSTALSLVLILSTLGFILAIVFETKVNDQIVNSMTDTLQHEYGVNLDNDWNKVVTDAWDGAQHKWRCCGVRNNGYDAYRSSEWQKSQPGGNLKPLVPLSCCVRDQYNRYINEQKCQTWTEGPPTLPSGPTNEALFYRGCYEAGKEVLNEVTGYLIGIGVALAILVIGGLILSIILARNV